jgi:hypothetical protein
MGEEGEGLRKKMDEMGQNNLLGQGDMDFSIGKEGD